MTWGMVGAAAVTVVGGALLGGGSGSGSSGASSSTGVYDPYAQYRPQAAQQLNKLMTTPGSVQDLPSFQAEEQAASRTMAAQGYTGSGNALVAAANAGGTAYQQAFNNLSLLSGAGQNPASAQQAANQQANYQQGQSNQMWGQIGGIAGQVINSFSNNSSPTINDNTVAAQQLQGMNTFGPVAGGGIMSSNWGG